MLFKLTKKRLMEKSDKEFEIFLKDQICGLLKSNLNPYKSADIASGKKLAIFKAPNQIIIINPNNKDQAFSIDRRQQFIAEEKKLIEKFIEEWGSISNNTDINYKSSLIERTFEVSICKFLSEESYSTFTELLSKYKKWSSRTYEGRKVAMAFCFDLSKVNTSSSPSIFEILEKDFSALLSNGINSVILCDKLGQLINYEPLEFDNAFNGHAPEIFSSLAKYTLKDNYLSLCLTINGDILIFKKGNIIFSKRSNKWTYFNHDALLKQLSGGTSNMSDQLKKSIYNSILDVSFSRTGGTIAIIDKKKVKEVVSGTIVKKKDLLSNSTELKALTISTIIAGREFYNLPRVLRKELLGIDGATIIDSSGSIISVGAIISIPSGSSGGGRTASTKELSKYGKAIKISADGMVTGYRTTKDEGDEGDTDDKNIIIELG